MRNLVAEKDRSIQLGISEHIEKDGFSMFVIAVLTALFLPGTFMAVRSQ